MTCQHGAIYPEACPMCVLSPASKPPSAERGGTATPRTDAAEQATSIAGRKRAFKDEDGWNFARKLEQELGAFRDWSEAQRGIDERALGAANRRVAELEKSIEGNRRYAAGIIDNGYP